MDLANQTGKVMELSGEWCFYEGVLSPEEIDAINPSFVKVPAYWPVGKDHKKYGSGLYHVRIKNATEEWLAIRLERVHTSYQVWVEDRLVHQSGQPSVEEKNEVPGLYNRPILFKPPKTEFNLYIGVSNHWYARGGIVRKVFLGEADQVQESWMKGLINEIAWTALIFTISLFTLLMFFIGHRQIAYLYFALFCFFSVLRLTTIEHLILGVVFPEVPFFLVSTFRYVGFFMSGTFIALYCEKLVPTMHRHWIVKLMVMSGLICTTGILLAPTWMGTYFSMLFQASTFISFIGFYFLLAKAISKGRKDLLLVGLSITSIVIGFTRDVLAVAEVVPWKFWQLPGFVFASVLQLLYFALEYKSLNEKVDNLKDNFTALGIVHQEKSEFERLLINEIKGQLNTGQLNEGFLKAILKKMNSGPIIPANQKVMIEAVDQVSEGFLLKLKKTYPDLTQKEIELSLSLKARLSTKEIAVIRNMTTDSVKKARSRLRKKLDLGKGTDLYQFFESF